MLQFSEKVALITGGGSGLGAEIAITFAKEGASVIVNDIAEERAQQIVRQVKETGGSATCIAGDVSSVDDVKNLVSCGMKAFGKIDILINNAGIADTITDTVEQEIDQWQRIIDIHLRGTYLLSKLVGEKMIANRYGKIINISSIAGVVGLPKRNAYSSAKAGVIMFTRVLACEWAKFGINVNAVAPGYIMTPMVDELLSNNKIADQKVRKRIPFGHLGQPSDIAKAVLFLASDDAKYITGTCLPVDGGWSAFGDSGDAFEM